MIEISIEEKLLELKFTWKIARNASDFKKNFFIKISDGKNEALGECAPNVRYGENVELIKSQFSSLMSAGLCDVHHHESLIQLFAKINTCNSLRFAIESAFIHFWCKRDKISVAEYLNISICPSTATAFTLPIMPTEEMCDFYQKYNLQRFKHLKLKINAENAEEALVEILKVAKQPIMIDGNEAFQHPDEVLKYIDFIYAKNVLFLEQPMPAKMVEEYIYLKPKSKILLMGDESITDTPNMKVIAQQFHGVNMKLQKAGGYVNGLRIINEAKLAGLYNMIGCMVETSLGIGSAMNLCANIPFVDLDGFLILKEEPFQLITEKEGVLSFK